MDTANPADPPLVASPHSASKVRRDIVLLCGICLILLVPFVNRPYHIDDPLFIWIAQHIRAHPVDFYGFNLNWERQRAQPASVFFENPPLTPYLLAAVSCVTGFEPLGFHLSFLLLDLLSVIGMYLLASRFCRQPLLAAMLLLFCPAFLVSATTLMSEPLFLCCWIWAVVFWIRGTTGNLKPFFVSGALVLAAVLAKFLAIVIVPLLAFYAVTHPGTKRLRWIQSLALIIPVAGAVSYDLYVHHCYGTGGILHAMSYVSHVQSQIARVPKSIKVLNTFSFLGGCAVPAVVMLPLIVRRWITAILILSAAVLTFAVGTHYLPPDGWTQPVPGSHLVSATIASRLAYYGQYIFWMMAGAGVALLMLMQLAKSIRIGQWHDELFLFAWAVGIFVFTAAINWSINARSILPMLPAVCILIARAMDWLPNFPRYRVALLLVMSAILSESIAGADYNLACAIQSAAAKACQLAAQRFAVELNPKATVWFFGHWGFQYYMEKAGGRPIDVVSSKLQPGDLVVYPHGQYGGLAGGKNFHKIDGFISDSDCWIATVQIDMGAGFYAGFGYQLPFVFGPIPREKFDILEVTPQTRLIP